MSILSVLKNLSKSTTGKETKGNTIEAVLAEMSKSGGPLVVQAYLNDQNKWEADKTIEEIFEAAKLHREVKMVFDMDSDLSFLTLSSCRVEEVDGSVIKTVGFYTTFAIQEDPTADPTTVSIGVIGAKTPQGDIWITPSMD